METTGTPKNISLKFLTSVWLIAPIRGALTKYVSKKRTTPIANKTYALERNMLRKGKEILIRGKNHVKTAKATIPAMHDAVSIFNDET